MTSSAWVPMDPVEPSSTTRRTVSGLAAKSPSSLRRTASGTAALDSGDEGAAEGWDDMRPIIPA
ncbi:hypothetical protein GCM10009674_04730 [Nesterenkonia xinjiangensis]